MRVVAAFLCFITWRHLVISIFHTFLTSFRLNHEWKNTGYSVIKFSYSPNQQITVSLYCCSSELIGSCYWHTLYLLLYRSSREISVSKGSRISVPFRGHKGALSLRLVSHFKLFLSVIIFVLQQLHLQNPSCCILSLAVINPPERLQLFYRYLFFIICTSLSQHSPETNNTTGQMFQRGFTTQIFMVDIIDPSCVLWISAVKLCVCVSMC